MGEVAHRVKRGCNFTHSASAQVRHTPPTSLHLQKFKGLIIQHKNGFWETRERTRVKQKPLPQSCSNQPLSDSKISTFLTSGDTLQAGSGGHSLFSTFLPSLSTRLGQAAHPERLTYRCGCAAPSPACWRRSPLPPAQQVCGWWRSAQTAGWSPPGWPTEWPHRCAGPAACCHPSFSGFLPGGQRGIQTRCHADKLTISWQGIKSFSLSPFTLFCSWKHKLISSELFVLSS